MSIRVKNAGAKTRNKLSKADWSYIAEMSASGQASSLWKVGDEKEIVLYEGNSTLEETVTAVILEFNHDGDSGGITFGLKDTMRDSYNMGTAYASSNVGGYTKTAVYTKLNNVYNNGLPSDLKSAIKSTFKKISAGNKSTTIESKNLYLFPFSEIEVTGTVQHSASGEGSQYEYFKNSNNIRASNAYWLRSPRLASAEAFCCITVSGSSSWTAATNRTDSMFQHRLRFGFCI